MYATQRQDISEPVQKHIDKSVQDILRVAKQLLQPHMGSPPPQTFDEVHRKIYGPGFGPDAEWNDFLAESAVFEGAAADPSSVPDTPSGDLTYDLPFTTFDPTSLTLSSVSPPPKNPNIQHTFKDECSPPPELRFLLLPLFLAGIETKDPDDRLWVSEALTLFDRGCLSPVSQTMKRVLGRIDILRMNANLGAEGNRNVDWLALLEKEEGRVIFWDV